MTDPKVAAYISSMDIDTSHLGDLFRTLDKDDNGSIDLHEFVANLLELMHGKANEQIMQKLLNEQKRTRYKLMKFASFVEQELHAIRCCSVQVVNAQVSFGAVRTNKTRKLNCVLMRIGPLLKKLIRNIFIREDFR